MKVPEPRKLKSGTWFIQLRLGGESIPVSAFTRSDCIKQAQLIKAQHRADAREVKYKTDKTVRDLMTDYIAALPSDTSPATIRGYEIIKAHRFQSVLDMPPVKIDWQKVIDAEPVAVKTLKNAWGFTASCLRAAGVPVPDVRLPRGQKKERPFLQPEDVLKVLPLLKGRKYEIPALLALHSLRRSEIMALDYSDIDIKSRTIHVHASAVQNADNKIVRKEQTKTAASTRYVPIMIPQLLDALQRTGKTSGPVWEGTPCALYRTMEDVCAQLGIPNVGAHGLRHSFASLAYHLGMSELEAMEIGGWSDYNTMRNIYTHLAKSDRLKAQNKMAAFYELANENANGSKND